MHNENRQVGVLLKTKIFLEGVPSHLAERSSGAGAGSSELMGGGDRSLSAVVGLVEN